MALGSVCLLLAWDAFPKEFPGRAHDLLGALPLALTAIGYLVCQALRHPSRRELVKATILAAAFMSWAVNQAWPLLAQATLLNDIAIALFVLDAFLVVMGWPPGSHNETLAETRPCNDGESDPVARCACPSHKRSGAPGAEPRVAVATELVPPRTLGWPR